MSIKQFIGVVIFFTCIGCSNKIQEYESSVLTNVIKTVNENHIAPKAMNEKTAAEIFNTFLEFIDPEKTIFLSKEIKQLKSINRNLNKQKNPSLSFIDDVYTVHRKAILRAEKLANTSLQNPFETLKDDYFESDFDKIAFTNEKGLKTRWNQTVKNYYLQKLYAVDSTEPDLTFEEKKTMAATRTISFFKNYFHDVNHTTKDDLTELYLSAFVSCSDYQSRFLSLETMEEWSSASNRSYKGIGVNIKTTANYPIIEKVTFNGPSWKTRKINVNDIILKVTNSDKEIVDLAGMPLKQVIDLLRGEIGTTVTIRTKNSKDEIQDIEIERGSIPMSKTFSFLIEAPDEKLKLGYINLPRFYGGEESASTHILKELKQLQQHNIDGILLDLRWNKGGSAFEAREIIGYFLKGGPIMQMAYADGEHRIFNDEDKSAVYSGKLIVLVNESSSSGSELVAGTLQDYGRAIIVGNQTYGKGTVQNFFDVLHPKNSREVGHLKLTIAKFYTGKGRSTQYNGVLPDIKLHSPNMYLKTGERTVKNVLKFNDLEQPTSNSNEHQKTIQKLQTLSSSRQQQNPQFKEIERKAQLNKDQQEQSRISLNYEIYKQVQDHWKNETIEQEADQLVTITQTSPDFSKEKMVYWRSKLENDVYIDEATHIMNDYLQQINQKTTVQ